MHGSLARIIGAKFFTQFDPAISDIFALLAFAAGFLARPFGALVFGRLGDLVGRKLIILAGCGLAALTYFPLFAKLTQEANPALYNAQQNIPGTVAADPADCHFQFNPTGTLVHTSSCDIAKQVLAGLSVPYKQVDVPAGTVAAIKAGSASVASFDAAKAGAGAGAARTALVRETTAALSAAGYPPAANPSVVKMDGPFDVFRPQTATIVGLLTVLMVYVTMVHSPIVFATVTLVIGALFVPETKDRDIFAEDHTARRA